MNKPDDILKETNCLTVQQMQDYLNGSMNAEEIRVVEVHLASCEFCSEALDGMEEMKDPEQVSLILKQVKRHVKGRIHVSHPRRRKQKNMVWLVVIIFVIILFLLVAFFWVDFKMKQEQRPATVPQQEQTSPPK